MIRNPRFARFLGSEWYRVEATYRITAVPAKTLAPTIANAPPRRAAPSTRNGVAAKAATTPTPWLTLFAISSPREGTCLRLANVIDAPTRAAAGENRLCAEIYYGTAQIN